MIPWIYGGSPWLAVTVLTAMFRASLSEYHDESVRILEENISVYSAKTKEK